MPEKATRSRLRRVLRVSLGGLMLMIVVLAASLGWVTNRARQQKRAVDAILARGGQILYRHDFDGLKQLNNAEPPGPKWLRKRLGDDYFRTPVRVFLYRPEFQPTMNGAIRRHVTLNMTHDDDIMAAFGVLTELERIGLDRGPSTDAGLAHIRGLTRLKSLYLHEGDDITDAGLAHLAGLKNLEFIDLKQARRITDTGVAHLAGLKSLTDISIPGENLTDASLKTLGSLPALDFLAIAGTSRDLKPGALEMTAAPYTDAGLAAISGLGRLKVLSMETGRASDVGIAELSKLGQLEQLTLFVAPEATRGLSRFRTLTKLKRLNLTSPRFDDEGLASLASFPALSTLTLRSSILTDPNLDRIAEAKQISSLTLHCPSLTDEQIAHVASMKDLKTLVIFKGEKLSDRALENLRGLDSLENLVIGGGAPNEVVPTSRITDRGLAATSVLPALKRLLIGSPAITKGAVARLKKERPELRVTTPSAPQVRTPRPAPKKKAAAAP